ncbi:MAG: HYR domain-containing protein, partial [Bacteroidota bacterium]
VNFNRLHSAIHTSGNTAGLKITNNKITGTRTSASNIGAYGTRNAIVLNRISLPYGTYAADYTNMPSGFANLTVTGNTVAGTTTAQNTFADAYFRAAIDMDLLGNVEISGNNLQAINHDVSYRFGNNGKVWIRNNIFNGGGIEHTELNGGADSTIISNNVFNNAPITDPTISLLRLKNNTADKPVLVQKNTFNNAFWYIAVENFRNLVIDSNTFTGAGANAKLVTVNTKTTATSTVANVNLSVTLTRNTFNVGTATNATALGFYNHKNDPANYGTFVLGTNGNENRFGAGFTNFIYLDTNNATPTRVATTPLAGFPEYGGSIAISTTGYWTANMRADQNFYNLGTGAIKATAMSPAQRATLETRLFHKIDNNNVGLLETYFPVQNVNTGNLYASIQSAIDSATAGDTIKLDTVTFTEMVVINKALTLQGTTDSTTILTYDAVPSTSVIPTLIKVTAQNVTIKNIGFKVNFNRLHSAIHTSGNTAGLKIMNNKITATRTSTSNIGAYGTRNAIVLNRISLPYGTYAADYTNIPSGFANVTVTGNKVAGTTTAQNTFADAYFRAAIDMDLLGNVEISGNNLQAINHDVSYRFGNNGKVWIRNNIFNGGGIEHTELNGGADSTIISNNVFNNAPITDPTISLLRLKNNTADKPVLVQKNTFNNAFWYIAVENFRNLVIDSNTFTGAGANAKLVTVNTKTTATSTVANVNLSVTLTRNTFNVGTATNATALGFYNHKNDPANYGTFVLGTNGNENRFGAGFTNFIYLDTNNATPTRVATTPLAGFPEYGGSIAISTTGYWTADLDAIHNFFNLGAGSVKATAMSPAQRAMLETRIFHKIDNSNIGLVNTYFQSIPAISAINDTNIACPSSASSVVVNFTVADSQTPLDSLKLTAASSDTSVIRLNNIVFGGTGANRTATISAVNGKVGSSTITFKVKDEQNDSAITSFVVTVADSIKPVVRTRNINAFLNASGTVTISYTQIDSSSSDNCTITSMRLSDSVFTCAKIGANMVRLIATDIAGNKDSAMAVVFVKDTIKPTVIGQNITRYLNASGTVTVNAGDLNNGSTDAVCGGLTYMISKSTFNCSNRGLNAVRLIATDSSGNKDSVGVNITILDTLKPVAMAQSSILIYLTDSGKANITPAMVNNGSNDNCSIDSMWVTPSQVTCADKGVKKVTLHVRDLSGNTDTISVNALVTDPVAPVARAKAKVTAYLNINGQAVVNAAGLDSASTDNCSITSRVLSQSVFTCAERGNNNVILTVQDQSGNSATDTVIVEVRDTIKPNAFVQNQVIYLNASGTATLNPASVNSGSTDNCGVDSIWISKTTFNASNLGNNIDTLIIRDASNNITKTTFIVTVSDSSKPTAIAQTTTAYLNAAGTVTVNAASVNNGSTDNSGAMTYSLSRSTFTCADIGAQNVSFTATDASNNSSTVPVTINVTDTIKPVISTQNIITYLDASGAATVTASQLNNNSTDNCSISQVNASKLNFTCVERGSNNVTLTVKDASNNSSTGNVVITVLDTMRPTAIAKSNISVYVDAAGNATLTMAMVNNGSFDNCFIASMNLSKTAFDKTNLGSNTITFTVTDSSGNVKAIPVVISVLDSIKPNAIAQNKTIYLGNTGVATITAAEVNNASTDNVGVKTAALSQTTFNCSNKGINVVILTVTDSSGNSDTAQATITVSDTTRPVLTAPLNNLTFGQCGAVVNYALPQASDNCASFTISQTNGLPSGSKFPAGVTTNTFVISDASNNSITVSFTVTISGGYLPVTFSNIEICASVPPFDLSQGKDSLVFEGNGIGLDRKTFDPSLAGSGNHRITYKYTDSTGCENSGTFFVTVFSSPETPVIERKTANVLSVTNSYNSYQWYRDGEAINGENKQTIVVKQSGVYTVIVGTIRGCSGVSAAIGIGVPTGINTIDNRISYNVYPNPSSGKFVIEKGSNAKRTTIITVTDIVGKTITTISSDDDIVDMDLSTLAAGTYYLRLQNGDATSVKPIIIK